MISIAERLLSQYQTMIEETEDSARPRARKQFHVVPHERGWVVESEGGFTTSIFRVKTDAAQAAIDLAHNYGEPCQVIVHKRNGKIQLEWTYPRSSDPRETKG